VQRDPLTPREKFEIAPDPLGPRGERPTPLDRRIK
jgi:hypothetical protein